MKKLFKNLLLVSVSMTIFSCSNQESSIESSKEELSVVYEAIFLNNDEVTNLFYEVRGEPPYENVTKDFHVTSAFLPNVYLNKYYGAEVTIHINSYAAGNVLLEDGTTTANEGFFVTLSTENIEFQNELDSIIKIWHITGSYKDAPVHTALLVQGADTFIDNLNYSIKGTFGAFLTDQTITYTDVFKQ